MPLVSFVVPVYRAENDLSRCIDSIINQTIPDWELILVDDGSPDASGKICDQYVQKDTRIRVIHQKNQGVSVARNNGINATNGEWLSFVDADDWVAPFAIELLVKYQSCGDLLEFPASSTMPMRIQSEIHTSLLDNKELANRQLQIIQGSAGQTISQDVRMYWGAPWGKFYLSSLVKENNIRFPVGVKRGEDVIFNLYAYKSAKRIFTVLQPFYYYRMSSTSVTLEYNPKEKELMECRRKKLEKFVRQMYLPDLRFQEALQVFSISAASSCLIRDFCHPENPQSYRIRRRSFFSYLQQSEPKIEFSNVRWDRLNARDKILGRLIQLRSFFVMDKLVKLYIILRKNNVLKNM